MKNVKLQKFRPVIGIIIMLLTFVLILTWENFGRDNLLYTNTIELKDDVDAGTVITAKMLTTGRTEKDKIIKEAVTTDKDVIGKIAKDLIPKGIQLDKRFFDTKDLSIKKDQYVFRVPASWIIAIPSSIRRGDIAYFYEIDSQSVSKMTNNLNSSAQSKIGSTQPQSTNSIQPIDNESIPQIKQELNKILLSCTIIYVKDSSNREVITTSKDPRYDGSSQISEVEIISSLEQVQKLKDSVNNGNKFIILY